MRLKRFNWLLFLLLLGSCGQNLTHSLYSFDNARVDSTVGADSAMLVFIEPYTRALQGVMNEVIGTSPRPFIAEKPESPLSNFVADLVLEAGKIFLASQNIHDAKVLCVINVRGLRAPLPEGEITTRNIFEIMPFENQMVAVKMNASDLESLFNHIALSNGDGLSGASFLMDGNVASDVLVGGKPVDVKRDYWVITSNFLADGGDNYTMFKNSCTRLVSDQKIRELITGHIINLTRQGLEVNPDTTIRIRVKTGG